MNKVLDATSALELENPFWKDLWLEQKKCFRRFSAKVHIGTLETYWELFCKIAERSS